MPLALTPLLPGISAPFVAWVVAGIGMSFLLPAGAQIVREIPSGARGRVMGLAQSGIMVGQGSFLLIGGVVGGALGVGWAIGISGLASLLVAVALFRVLHRHPERAPDLAEGTAVAERLPAPMPASMPAAVAVPRPRDAPAEDARALAGTTAHGV